MIRATRYGFSLMLAIIDGAPERFALFPKLFRRALTEFGYTNRPIGIHSPGHVADTDEQARSEFWPRYLGGNPKCQQKPRICDTNRRAFSPRNRPRGLSLCRVPDTVAKKIAATVSALEADRFDLKYGMGGLRHDKLMRTIELYGTEVIPHVRALLG